MNTGPPSYNFGLSTCPIGEAALSVGQEVVMELAFYYKTFDQPMPAIDHSFAAALPRIGWNPVNITNSTSNPGKTWISWGFHAFLGLFSLNPGDLLAFWTSDRPWSFQWIVESSLKCDMSSQITCSGHRADLIMTVVVFLLFYVVAVPVCQGIGLEVLATLFWYSGPAFVLW